MPRPAAPWWRNSRCSGRPGATSPTTEPCAWRTAPWSSERAMRPACWRRPCSRRWMRCARRASGNPWTIYDPGGAGRRSGTIVAAGARGRPRGPRTFRRWPAPLAVVDDSERAPQGLPGWLMDEVKPGLKLILNRVGSRRYWSIKTCKTTRPHRFRGYPVRFRDVENLRWERRLPGNARSPARQVASFGDPSGGRRGERL